MTCFPAGTVRVITGRHLDRCENPECPGCQPCPEHHCSLCRRVHAEDVCPHCLGTVRTNLHTMRTLATHLPAQAANGRPAYVTRTNMPGGDALALMGPGADPEDYRAALDHRLLNQLDTSHTQEEHRADPKPPMVVLTMWTNHWRAQLQQPTTLASTLDRTVDYLDTHLTRLAPDPAFPLMARDLADAVRQMENVLHDGIRPETSRVPCWECGTRLVKVYTARVSDDHWLCPHCGEKYDRGRYDRAKHDHLASNGAARFVLVSDATSAIGRPAQTVRSWIRRQQVETALHPRTGRLLVWWPDVRNQHLASDAPRVKGQVTHDVLE